MGNQIYFKIAGKKKWIEGSNRQTQFWKRTFQRLFHQNFVLIEQMVSDKNIFWEFPIGSYVKLSSAVVAILVVF